MHPTAGHQAPSSEQMSVGWFMAGEGGWEPVDSFKDCVELRATSVTPVSYTHLDVYKRQPLVLTV